MVAKVELHKLNGDSTWLLRLPHTNSADHYNLLVDPWLDTTAQIDVSVYVSKQTRVEKACFGSITDIDQWLRNQVEGHGIDAILFSHPFTDHLHPETLRDEASKTVLQRVLILTTADSYAILKSLDLPIDYSKVVNLSSVVYKQDGCTALPTGISVDHLLPKDWYLSPAWRALHSGIAIKTDSVQILYCPHGITPRSLPPNLKAHDDRRKRILVHSFDKQSLPLIGTVACGFPNIKDLAPVFRPHLVLATHDEHKVGEGVVGKLLTRKTFSQQQVQDSLHTLYPDLDIHVQVPAPGDTVYV